jgi:AmmeMemoRadiSam system protein A
MIENGAMAEVLHGHAGAAAGRGAVLLALARQAIEESLGLPAEGAEAETPWLREPGATFVTLMRGGRLRGCVGSIRARRPLGEDVRANARAAAFSDPRFPPLAAAEWPETMVEVSLLSPPAPLAPAASEAEAAAALRPGVDGVVLEYRDQAATYLPQVWKQLPEPRQFLAHLKQKAGLPRELWSLEVRLLRYAVEKWTEGDRG